MILLSNVKKELVLFERHIKVLKALIENEPVGILRLSRIVKMPSHQVRYSLRILQQSGFLEPTTKGAVTNRKAKNFVKEIEKEKSKILKRIDSI